MLAHSLASLLACSFASLLACLLACSFASLLARLLASLLARLFACSLARLFACSLARFLACSLACFLACLFACLLVTLDNLLLVSVSYYNYTMTDHGVRLFSQRWQNLWYQKRCLYRYCGLAHAQKKLATKWCCTTQCASSVFLLVSFPGLPLYRHRK